MLDQQQGAERGARDYRPESKFYRRPMPGGGYVEVELEVLTLGASEQRDCMLRGRIVMERRSDPKRRSGHQAPVVAELVGDDRDELMADLFQLAQDNAALARNLMRLQAALRPRAD
jgi:hypothetical protein